jgi:hypothetical protein
MTLAELKAALADTEAHIQDILKTGKSYSLDGSHSLTHEDLPNLETRASNLRARIYRYHGHTGRSIPDFSG